MIEKRLNRQWKLTELSLKCVCHSAHFSHWKVVEIRISVEIQQKLKIGFSSNSCERRRFLKKKCIFTIWLIWPRPGTRTPAPGGHEIYKFGRRIFCHHYYKNVLSLSEPCPGVKQKIIKEILHFLPKNYPPPPLW